MSLFKKWGKKTKKDKDRDYAHDKYGGITEGDEETLNLPPFERAGGRRDQRNLSISRSGRHKYKAKPRTNLEDVFGEGGGPPPQDKQRQPQSQQQQQQQQHQQQSRDQQGSLTRAGAHARPAMTSANASSVAKTSGVTKAPAPKVPVNPSGSNYHCRESESSANKLSGSQRMARAPTAV